MLAFRTVQQSNHCAREEFLYELKAGPAGGLRPPSGPATTRRSPGNRPDPSHQAAIDMYEGETFMQPYADQCRPLATHNVGLMRRLGH